MTGRDVLISIPIALEFLLLLMLPQILFSVWRRPYIVYQQALRPWDERAFFGSCFG